MKISVWHKITQEVFKLFLKLRLTQDSFFYLSIVLRFQTSFFYTFWMRYSWFSFNILLLCGNFCWRAWFLLPLKNFELKKWIWKNPGWLQVSLKSFKTVSDQSGKFWLKELQPSQTLSTISFFNVWLNKKNNFDLKSSSSDISIIKFIFNANY